MILRLAGQDATDEYDLVHSSTLLKEAISESSRLGPVEPSGPTKFRSQLHRDNATSSATKSSLQVYDGENPPPLGVLINLDDFERVAKRYLPPNAWAYYRSGADDEITTLLNRRSYQRVLLRARVMRNVERIDTRTTILGQQTSMPLFASPTALAKLAHRRGECAIAAAIGAEGMIQVVSSSSSMSFEDIKQARAHSDQAFFFQIYINPDLHKTVALIQRVEKLGAKAIWITVDSPVMGKREEDERLKAEIQVGCPILLPVIAMP